jgi:hypothetical protein
MVKRSRNRIEKQTLTGPAILVRLERGEMREIANEMGVDPSLVSRVVAGKKTSARVAARIFRYLARKAEVSEPAGVSCGPREMGARWSMDWDRDVLFKSDQIVFGAWHQIHRFSENPEGWGLLERVSWRMQERIGAAMEARAAARAGRM